MLYDALYDIWNIIIFTSHFSKSILWKNLTFLSYHLNEDLHFFTRSAHSFGKSFRILKKSTQEFIIKSKLSTSIAQTWDHLYGFLSCNAYSSWTLIELSLRKVDTQKAKWIYLCGIRNVFWVEIWCWISSHTFGIEGELQFSHKQP